MRANELLRRLRSISATRNWPLDERQGKGAHLIVVLNGRRSVISMHSGDMPTGTYRAILKALGLKPDDLEG